MKNARWGIMLLLFVALTASAVIGYTLFLGQTQKTEIVRTEQSVTNTKRQNSVAVSTEHTNSDSALTVQVRVKNTFTSP